MLNYLELKRWLRNMDILELKLSLEGIESPEVALVGLQEWLQKAGVQFELERKLRETKDSLIANFIGDALRGFHYKNYRSAEESINKASVRAIELATVASQTPETIKVHFAEAAELTAFNADLNESLNNYVKAAEYRVRVAELLPEGTNEEWLARYLRSTVNTLKKQGHYRQAIPLQQKALAITERLCGAKHPHVATSLNNLAVLYEQQGDTTTAKPLYERSLAIREKVLGTEHPTTQIVAKNYAGLRAAMIQSAEAPTNPPLEPVEPQRWWGKIKGWFVK